MRPLRKIRDEGKVKLVEPSKIICVSYMEKSLTSLVSAQTLYRIGNYNDAVALSYYSMYYSALALLYLCGIKSESHRGTILLLKEVFILDTSELELAKKDRIDKQYYVDFSAQKADVEAAIKTAESWNSSLKAKADTMKLSEIENYRIKANDILNG